MDNDLRIGIIGLGQMGCNHLRVLSAIPQVKEISVVEFDDDKRQANAAKYRVHHTYKHLDDFLEKSDVDACVIAVQPEYHAPIAHRCFQRSLPVLLEKPIAHTREDAAAITRSAREHDCLCLVGHIERFNPVVRKAKEFIEEGRVGKPYLCNTRRGGPFPKRLLSTNLGVLVDLAVHDVDIIQYLSGSEVQDVQSMFIKAENREIYAMALYRCESDMAGSMEFSWVSPQKVRRFQLFGTLGLIEGDYISQSLHFYENPDINDDDDPWATKHLVAGRIASGRIIEYPVWRSEPLHLELQHFLSCVRGEVAPEVTPQMAAQVVDVVLDINEKGTNSPTTIKCQLQDGSD